MVVYNPYIRDRKVKNMKRKIIAISLIGMALSTFVVCSKDANSITVNPVVNETAALNVIELNIKDVEESGESREKDNIAACAGTYLSDKGIVLFVKEDGTFDYTWLLFGMKDDEILGNKDQPFEGTWTYENDELCFSYKENFNINFVKAGDNSWVSQGESAYLFGNFTKYSSKIESKTVEEYREILKCLYGKREYNGYSSDSYYTLSIGGLQFKIPEYWTANGEYEGNEGQTVYVIGCNSYDSLITVVIGVVADKVISRNDFVQVVKGAYNQSTGVRGNIVDYDVNGNAVYIWKAEMIIDEVKYETQEACIWNKDNGLMTMLMLSTPEDSIFTYDSDFEKVVFSVKTDADVA